MPLLKNLPALAGIAIMAAGCGIDPNKSLSENYDTVYDNVTSSTGLQSCALGGLGGAVIGGVAADNKAAGILGGGAIGALAGCTVGATLSSRRQDYATQAEFYDKQLEIVQASNKQLKASRGTLKTQIDANERTIADLSLQRDRQQLDSTQARASAAKAEKEYEQAAAGLESAEKEVEVQRQGLQGYDPAQGKVDQAKLAKLSAQVDDMEGYVETLKKQVDELAAQRDAIGQFS